jgi:hypothetical protein
MRWVLRRVSPWSAARVGAFLGMAAGIIIGIAFVSLTAAFAPVVSALGGEVEPAGWASLVLFSLLNGGVTGVLFAVCASLYNLLGRIGISFEFDVDPAECDDVRVKHASGPLLGSRLFEPGQ